MKIRRKALCTLALIAMACFIIPAPASSEDATGTSLSLQQVIDMAIEANLNLKSSKEEINAALSTKKQSRSGFLPRFNATYQYIRQVEDPVKKSVLTGFLPLLFIPIYTYVYKGN